MLFSIRIAESDHLFGEELFIRFTVRVYRESLSICVCVSFPFGFEGGMGILIALVPDQTFYFAHRPVPEYEIIYL